MQSLPVRWDHINFPALAPAAGCSAGSCRLELAGSHTSLLPRRPSNHHHPPLYNHHDQARGWPQVRCFFLPCRHVFATGVLLLLLNLTITARFSSAGFTLTFRQPWLTLIPHTIPFILCWRSPQCSQPTVVLLSTSLQSHAASLDYNPHSTLPSVPWTTQTTPPLHSCNGLHISQRENVLRNVLGGDKWIGSKGDRQT